MRNLNISVRVNTHIKKRNLIDLIEAIEPSEYFFIDLTVSARNKRKPLLDHIHAMIGRCAHLSGTDLEDMKAELKGIYMCDIRRNTEKKFRKTAEAYEESFNVSLQGEVCGIALQLKSDLGKASSLGAKSDVTMPSLRFFRDKVEAHLGLIEAHAT